MKAPINTALAMAITAVVMIVSLEVKHGEELEVAFDLGTENGKKIANIEIKESLKKQVTDKACMSWWFSGDTKRVGESIKKVKLEK